MTVTLKCLDPTKTITRGLIYHGTPVKKVVVCKHTGHAPWVECSKEEATSYQVQDKYNITRRISVKRFKVY
ncbi:MAG: hypothetical protein KUG81_04550 [Gammaproteobacteria bacterium]|nr:hypothetical protein [Gammaproteobacteria bacterium]